MKKEMTVLLLFALIMNVSSSPEGDFNVNVVNSTIYNVDAFTRRVVRDLGVTGVIIFINPLSGTTQDGYTFHQEKDDGFFSIYIKESVGYDKFLLILAHELVHVKQLHFKETAISANVKFNYHYDRLLRVDKKYEDEANTLGDLLFKKYKNVR